VKVVNNLILSSDETNPQYDIIKGILILLSNETINRQDPLTALATIVSASETILKNEASRAIFRKLLEDKVITAPSLVAGGMSAPTVYRTLARFETLGIIESVTSSRAIKGKPGPRVVLYGLRGEWSPEDILQAGFKLESLRVPGMALVTAGTQMILDEYSHSDGVKFSEIIEKIKPLSSGYNVMDISQLVAKGLTAKGLKVWR
jgi:DNA-binding transcriptional ArsR family regulator